MFWKYFLVNLLLVISTKWILTSATLDTSPDDGTRSGPELTESELIDKIVAELQGKNLQEEYRPTGNAEKKNKATAHDEANNQVISNVNPQEPGPKDTSSSTNTNGGDDGTVDADQNSQDSGGGGNEVMPPFSGQAAAHQDQPQEVENKRSGLIDPDDRLFIIIIAVAVSTGFVCIMMAGVCYYKLRKSAKAANDVEYPGYGVTGPVKDRIPSPGDRKLAQSAQMYHYQHQKQQMIAMEKANGDMKHDASEDDSEEENMEGDYTVYECPGLAPTGEMEVRNPLFRGEDDQVTESKDITNRPQEQEPQPGHQHGNL